MIFLDDSIDCRFDSRFLDKEIFDNKPFSYENARTLYLDTKEATEYMLYCFAKQSNLKIFTDCWDYSDSVLSEYLIESINQYGKIDVFAIDYYKDKYGKPLLLLINNTLPSGISYSLNELSDIYNYCQTNNIYLFIDGDRLANAVCEWNTEWIPQLLNNSDMFSIGGVRYGAIWGVVCLSSNDYFYDTLKEVCSKMGILSSHKSLLSKHFGYFINSGLYEKNGRIANLNAKYFSNILSAMGIPVVCKNSNHVIVKLKKHQHEILSQFAKYIIKDVGSNSIIADFVFQCYTTGTEIEDMIKILDSCNKET